MLKRRLYLQIYFIVIGSLVMVAVLSGILWSLFGQDHFNRDVTGVVSRLVSRSLPADTAPIDVQRAAVVRLGEELGIDVTLFDSEQQLIASNAEPSPPPKHAEHRAWRRGPGGTGVLQLPDGRWVVIDFKPRGGMSPPLRLALFLGSIAFSVGVISYPFVRRLTRRLERLQKGVEQIGAGDLTARVEVQGRDEVAGLARSFNDAAAKIEDLLSAHRLLLANASHELRTPLARIRLGVEMLNTGQDIDRHDALRQDIEELDELIDEILLMSKLDAGTHADLSECVDLLALSAEEGAHFSDITISGSAPEVPGDPRLLRRLIRNLLENASLHGAPPIELELVTSGDKVILRVSDGGSGIAPEDRENVFQPFYRAAGKQNVRGYGLGLPLVRQIAEAHGGSATVLAGEISLITVTLPV